MRTNIFFIALFIIVSSFFTSNAANAQTMTGDPVKNFAKKEKKHDAAEAVYLKNPTPRNMKKFQKATTKMGRAYTKLSKVQ